MGLSLSEVLTKHTNRQLRTIEEWIKEDWNNPSRSDFYQMQTTQAILSANSKKRSKLDEFKLKFGLPQKKRRLTAADRERITQQSKARWRARMNRN